MAYWRSRRRSKKARKFSEIEAEIRNIGSRQKNYNLWLTRNSLYAERRKWHCDSIRKRIDELYRSDESYKKVLGLIRSNTFTLKAQESIKALQRDLERAEKAALLEVPMLDIPEERYQPVVSERLKAELAKAKSKENKIEKQRITRARIAQAEGKTREVADTAKIRLPRNHICPYCGMDLGAKPHADHIYPVARGGLSTKSNMVYVCVICNLRKKDKTLKMFAEEFGLNRNEIESRLTALGKEF